MTKGNRIRHSNPNTDRNTNDPNANLNEEERKAKAAREAANRDADNESPNHREAALNRKRNTLNDQMLTRINKKHIDSLSSLHFFNPYYCYYSQNRKISVLIN